MAYTVNWDMINSLVAPTYVKRIRDQFFMQNAALYRVKGRTETEEGPFVVQPLSYTAEGGGGGWYSGADKFDTRVRDPFTAATFFWANAHVPLAVTGDQELAVTGPRAIVKLVEAKMTVAENTMIELLGGATGLFNDGTDPKAIGGLQLALKSATTGGETIASHTYGGITATNTAGSEVNPWWLHAAFNPTTAYVTGSGGTFAYDNFEPLEMILGKIGLRSDRQPTMWFCNWGVFRDITSALIKNERYGRPQQDSSLAKVGFKNVLFKDMPIVVDRRCPRNDVSKIEKMYAIDEKELHWYVHPARNMYFQPWARPIDQDARIAYIFNRCSLAFSARRTSGVIDNIDTTATS